MSGTDPDPNDPIDATRAWRPADRAPTSPPPAANLPRIPGITLHHELARGGMGVVYSGRQDFLDRRVAVKLLSVELGGDSFAQRFQREAKILAGIKHPNIVACHMAGTTDDGQSYLVMEFIDGPNLKNWIGENGPLSVPAALRLTRAVGQALAHAHALGIIHRDVKPENILLETVTSTALDVAFPFTPKVVDLGLARASEGAASLGLTSPGSVMGTPATMSPEQYDEPDAVDFRSDIYGLGCAMYEMLTGQPAFRGKKLTDIVTQKRAPIAPNPCFESEVPAAVGALVQCMLASNRDDRPRSYKELDERLLELIETIGNARPAQPVVGEETEWGAGPMATRPSVQPPVDPWAEPKSPPKPTPPRGSKPPTPPPPAPAGKSGGPGFLGTAEINFLAEGLGEPGAGPASAPPAFQDPGATGAIPRSPAPAPALTSTPTPTPSPAPARRRPGRAAGAVAAVVIVAGAVAFLASGGGGSPGDSGKPNEPAPIAKEPGVSPPPSPKPKPAPNANRPPQVTLIGGPTEVAIGRQFTLAAEASDADGDTPSYTWTFPEDLLKLSRGQDRRAAQIKLEPIDGLPGLPVKVEVEVADGRGGVQRAERSLTIANFEVTRSWIGLKGKKNEWKLDRTEGWTDVEREPDPYLACLATGLRTATTFLRADPYWEWSGALECERPDNTKSLAEVGVRLEFDLEGFEVRCTRTPRSGSDAVAGKMYRLEIMKVRRDADGQWQASSLQPAQVREWPHDDDLWPVFSLRRVAGDLQIRIARAPVPEEPMVNPLVEQAPLLFETKVPEAAVEQNLTFWVDNGRGLFRVSSR